MNKCPLTYHPCNNKKYSDEGLRKLSVKLTSLEDMPLTAEGLRQEAMVRAAKMSIQGAQPKLSVKLNIAQGKFDIVDTNGKYILKPQTFFKEVPENEDLTMHMAKVAGIEVPLHGMVYAKDGTLCYFIKRFDRKSHNKKIPLEDFAQLAGKERETKYNYSMEKLSEIIEQFCTFPAREMPKLFRITLFCYLTGNEDMHLKNFSLIKRNNIIELSPAYDHLNSTIAMTNATEELALTLNGKKSNLTRKDLVEYYGKERLSIPGKIIENILHDLDKAKKSWENLINTSFLSDSMKGNYFGVLKKRLAVLGL